VIYEVYWFTLGPGVRRDDVRTG